MRKVIFVALALAAWCVTLSDANARPKFVGNCLSDDGVKKLFQTYTDVEQVGPWTSEEIRGRKKAVFMPDISTGTSGTNQTVINRTKKRIKLSAIPPRMTVVATICGSLGGNVDKIAAASPDEQKFYPNGKPAHWCGYGGPRKGVCDAKSWFQGYSARRHSIVFVNGAEAPQSGQVWAYVRPSDKND